MKRTNTSINVVSKTRNQGFAVLLYRKCISTLFSTFCLFFMINTQCMTNRNRTVKLLCIRFLVIFEDLLVFVCLFVFWIQLIWKWIQSFFLLNRNIYIFFSVGISYLPIIAMNHLFHKLLWTSEMFILTTSINQTFIWKRKSENIVILLCDQSQVWLDKRIFSTISYIWVPEPSKSFLSEQFSLTEWR